MQCENCGHTMFVPGQMGDMVQTSGECPNCGVPYRHQPGGDNVMGDEMAARGMPAPGEQDMGGNPLQEGIWGSIDGGWQNRMKRDESYASLRKKADDMEDEEFDWDGDDTGVDFDSLGNHAKLHSRFIVDPQGQVYTSQGMHEGTASLADLSKNDPAGIFHEDIARHYGLDMDERSTNPLPGHTTGEAWEDGDINFVTHETPFNADQMAQLLQPHYPNHNMPTMMPEQTTAEQRFGLPDTQRYPEMKDKAPQYRQQWQQADQAEQQRGRPFPFYDNPYFNRGGSHNPTREQLYASWQYEAADFEVDQVIEAGPHTEEVDVDGQKNPIILQHDSQEVLDEAKLELTSHKLAFLPLLMGLGAGALAGEAGAGLIGRGMISGLVRGAMGKGQGGTTIENNVGAPPPQAGGLPMESYSSIHESLSQSEHPSSIPKLNETDPEDVDPHEHEDGDHSAPIDDFDVNGVGGTDDPHDGIPVEGPVGDALEAALPALLHFYHSDEAGADDPTIKALIDVLENEHPGTLDTDPSVDDLTALDSLKTAKLSTGVLPVTPMPGMPGGGQQLPAPGTQQLQNPVAQPQQQVNPVSQANCPNCGARVSPGQGVCPQCGSGINAGGGQPEVPMQQTVQPQSPPVMGSPFTAALDPRAHDEALKSILARPDLAEHERQALNVAMAMRNNNVALEEARGRALKPGMFDNLQNPPAQRPDEVPPVSNMGRFAADGGPTNPEQFRMVKDYLIQNGREDLVPDLIDNPGNYADILAEIQGQGDRPQPDPDPGVPPPMPDPSQMGMDPAAMAGGAPPPGGMPMMGKTAWAPTRPNQGETNGVPNKGLGLESGGLAWWQHPPGSPEYEQGKLQEQAQQHALNNPTFADPRRAAADPVTPPCPNCGSHTTGMITDEGEAQCSNCNHKWKTDFDLQGEKTPVATKAAADVMNMPNPIATPAADQTAQDDPSIDVNPNIWTDQSGQPLQVGQEYEMYSARYDVPDVMRVTSIKPDSLEYVLTGEYGLEHRTAVSRQEAEMDGLTFLPTDQAEPEDAQPPQPAENPMAALSHQASWSQRLGGKKFTPMEQREFISEPGQARNSDKLDLAGTHYVEDSGPTDDFFIFGW